MPRSSIIIPVTILTIASMIAGVIYGLQYISSDDSFESVEEQVTTVAEEDEDSSETGDSEEQLVFDTPEDKSNHPKTGDGPWNGSIYIALANEISDLDRGEVLIEAAGVPDVIQLPDGRLMAIFQWFPDGYWFDYPAVIFSEDSGLTWTDPEPILLANYPDTWSNPFDPTLEVTEDGLIRLYFTSNPDKLTKDPDHKINGTAIYSALSSDGITYIFEEGIRFDDSEELTRDSTVEYFDGLWHIFAPGSSGSNTMHHGTSQNGLDFVLEDSIVSTTSYNWLGNAFTLDDQIAFLGGQGGLSIKVSDNGFDWEDGPEINVSGADGAIVQLDDGGYILVYTRVNDLLR